MKSRNKARVGGKVGPNRTPAERLQDRATIAKLLRRGWSQSMIAEHLGTSQGQVSVDWRIVLKEMRAQQTEDAKEHLQAKLEEHAEIKREAWMAWEESKKDKQRRTEKTSASEMGDRVEETLQTEGQCGDPTYLRIIKDCIDAECKLLGLEPEKKTVVSGTLTWDVFMAGMTSGKPMDLIEKDIQAALEAGNPCALKELTPEEKARLSAPAETNGDLVNEAMGETSE